MLPLIQVSGNIVLHYTLNLNCGTIFPFCTKEENILRSSKTFPLKNFGTQGKTLRNNIWLASNSISPSTLSSTHHFTYKWKNSASCFKFICTTFPIVLFSLVTFLIMDFCSIIFFFSIVSLAIRQQPVFFFLCLHLS